MKLTNPLTAVINNAKWMMAKPTFKVGDIIEDCRYEPSRVTGISRHDDTQQFFYETEGLVSGFKGSCGQNCGIRLITDLEPSIAFYKKLSKARNDEVAMELVTEWEDAHKVT